MEENMTKSAQTFTDDFKIHLVYAIVFINKKTIIHSSFYSF